jgi:hypothetical protein
MRAKCFLTVVAVLVAVLICGSALAGKKAPKSKPPEGYPAGVPYLAGGEHDPKLSFKGTVTLRYKGTVDKIAGKMLKMLEDGKWRIDFDEIPGRKGKRFLGFKGDKAIYFTVKPDYGKPGIIMIVTDTKAARR